MNYNYSGMWRLQLLAALLCGTAVADIQSRGQVKLATAAAWQLHEPDVQPSMEKFKSNQCFSGLMNALASDGSCSKLLNSLAASPAEAQKLRQTIAFDLTKCHYSSVERPCTVCLQSDFSTKCIRELTDAEFGIYTEFLSGMFSKQKVRLV